jgi:electron transfer flavoprotein beta subunit
MRQGVPAIINPYDLFALEQALALRDRLGGEVTVLTMGPPMAEDALRKALTFGADRAVLLTDRHFAGSDTLATTYALAAAIGKIAATWGTPSIVFAGKQTIDGDTAQVGPGVAKRLNLTQLTYVSRVDDVDRATGVICVQRRGEGGTQVLQSRLPVLITMLADLGQCGLRGSPTIVKSVFAPPARAEKAKQIPVAGASAAELAAAVVDEILAAKPSLEKDLRAAANTAGH